MGTVWGVAAVSTITQAALKVNLQGMLPEGDGKGDLIREIRGSVDAIRALPPALQEISQAAYYDSLRISFVFLFIVAVGAYLASFCSRTRPARVSEEETN